MTLSKKAFALLVGTNLVALGILVFVLLSGFAPARQNAHFPELSAERINIVSPSGKTVLAISNQERIAAPVVEGKTFPVASSDGRELMAGMIFFNQEGDEMGGLVFNSFRRPDGKYAGIGHLSFDRYRDNQVVALQYKENATTVQAGLTLYDRPADGSFRRALELGQAARAAEGDAREKLAKELADLSQSGALGVERIFLGSRNRVAQLVLKDSLGHVRARLVLDESENARLEFLDAAGAVTARFPG